MARTPVGTVKVEAAEAAAARVARPSARFWVLALVLLTLAVGVAARGSDLRAAGQRSLAHIALLRATMPAGYTLWEPEPARATGIPDGMAARAFARLAEAAGQPAAAEQTLAAAVAARPADGLTRFVLCRFYADGGRWAEARQTCAKHPESLGYWLLMGVRAVDGGRAEEAVELFRVAVSASPDDPVAWHQLGRATFAAHRFDEAIPAFERVLALDPGQPFDVFNSLGTAYLAAGDPEKAQATAARGLLIYPNHRELYLIVGESLRRQGELEAADDWYRQWLERWPEDTYAWAQRGELAMQRGRAAAAVSYFQQATVLEPQTAGFWLNLARAAADAGNQAQATTAYETALALWPDDAATWLLAGRFLMQTGQSERARAVYEHVLALQPDNGEAAAALAQLAGASAP